MNPTDTPNPQPLPPRFAAPHAEEPLPEKADLKTLLESVLRRPQALTKYLATNHRGPTGIFLLTTVLSFLLFGVVLGCFARHEQLWAAPLKITLGLLFSGIICFPSLFIFATLAGARTSVPQLAACLAGALSLAGLLLLGFAPAVWIFVESTDSFGFIGVLAIGAWLVAVSFSLKFLGAAIFATGGTQKGPLAIWSSVFLLVTLQMTTSLRPILGRSDQFLSQEKKFFLVHWGDYGAKSLGDPVTPATPAPRESSEQ